MPVTDDLDRACRCFLHLNPAPFLMERETTERVTDMSLLSSPQVWSYVAIVVTFVTSVVLLCLAARWLHRKSVMVTRRRKLIAEGVVELGIETDDDDDDDVGNQASLQNNSSNRACGHKV